jgi:hypothetical protein
VRKPTILRPDSNFCRNIVHMFLQCAALVAYCSRGGVSKRDAIAVIQECMSTFCPQPLGAQSRVILRPQYSDYSIVLYGTGDQFLGKIRALLNSSLEEKQSLETYAKQGFGDADTRKSLKLCRSNINSLQWAIKECSSNASPTVKFSPSLTSIKFDSRVLVTDQPGYLDGNRKKEMRTLDRGTTCVNLARPMFSGRYCLLSTSIPLFHPNESHFVLKKRGDQWDIVATVVSHFL